ncbi:phage antirepressor Ant [Clostridium sporogenes]|uniref:phage antirepressor KilAC domain-containing protein n=1 Tax=Clostridium sporogenes TaxID=1509 RepID=UPI0013D2700E|nr:phage antirepressor KilAC domain-containing protein [Clostridium sporogenes]NFF68918.1 phage antirepressor Ant [Clostridium sporogenes]NFG00375.1 phage antirepressor Ant [Clostridium sporogenes]NFG08022.1 phage antirepressor Ant [Clostridium sporogenes]NFG53223.1 phage antirepressor Ant [Clostridium sporogenes]NFP86036.1 phage antirepressor Ant [Clostridium sporogenes]
MSKVNLTIENGTPVATEVQIFKDEQLIPVNQNENGEVIISGRELHEFLGVKTKYIDWFERMKKYGFVENADFALVTQKKETNNPKNPVTEITDHAIKLDMAKELAMIQRNEKGKQARQYFIAVEKAWNSPEMIMKRALEIANKRVENLKLETIQQKQIIGELKPKADYTDTILLNKSLVTITQIAKDYGMSGTKLNEILHRLGVQYKQSNQWLLYSKHHCKGYTHSETIPFKHRDGRTDVKMNTKWTQKGRLFLYELLKENGILPTIEKEC